VHEGTVGFAGPFTGFGKLVILEHGDGTHSLYGHLRRSGSNGGTTWRRGRGRGNGRNPSGNPALYFELRVDGKPVDPLQWLRNAHDTEDAPLDPAHLHAGAGLRDRRRAAGQGAANNRDQSFQHLRVFEDVVSLVLNNYVEEVRRSTARWKARCGGSPRASTPTAPT
jgi:hypothetical protein